MKLLNLIGVVLILLAVAAAQDVTTLKDSTPKTRLRNYAIPRGFIGGESHDSYVIRVRKGQTLSAQLSWRREGDNRAEFEVVESPDFYTAELTSFGRFSKDGRRWTGKVPKTSDYFIYVVAHPTARYRLKVTVN